MAFAQPPRERRFTRFFNCAEKNNRVQGPRGVVQQVGRRRAQRKHYD